MISKQITVGIVWWQTNYFLTKYNEQDLRTYKRSNYNLVDDIVNESLKESSQAIERNAFTDEQQQKKKKQR